MAYDFVRVDIFETDPHRSAYRLTFQQYFVVSGQRNWLLHT